MQTEMIRIAYAGVKFTSMQCTHGEKMTDFCIR